MHEELQLPSYTRCQLQLCQNLAATGVGQLSPSCRAVSPSCRADFSHSRVPGQAAGIQPGSALHPLLHASFAAAPVLALVPRSSGCTQMAVRTHSCKASIHSIHPQQNIQLQGAGCQVWLPQHPAPVTALGRADPAVHTAARCSHAYGAAIALCTENAMEVVMPHRCNPHLAEPHRRCFSKSSLTQPCCQ